jgi:hypothetical protein
MKRIPKRPFACVLLLICCTLTAPFNALHAQNPEGVFRSAPSQFVIQQIAEGIVTRALTEAEEKTLRLDRILRSPQGRRWIQAKKAGQAGMSSLQFEVYITESLGFNSEFAEAGTNAIRRWTTAVRAFTH